MDVLTVLNWVSSIGIIINGVKEIIIVAGKLQRLEMSNQNRPVWLDTTNQGSLRKSITETLAVVPAQRWTGFSV